MNKISSYIIWIAVSFFPALVGSYFRPGIWYTELIKPDWTPPGWLFGPVWFTLYAAMGVAVAIIWNTRKKINVQLPIVMFIIQLIFNAAWSYIFFGAHLLLLSVIEIFILFILIGITIILFNRINKTAALLLLPYLLWVGFASVLNYNIWFLNN